MADTQFDHPAHPVIAEEFRVQGAAFPNAGAALVLKRLAEAGFTVTRQANG